MTICGKLLIRSCRKTWAVAALLVGLYLYPLPAHAQTAVWRGGAPPASPNPFDWNTAENWSTNPIVPNTPTAQANFDQNPNGNRGPITLSAPTSVSTLTFNAPDYRFAISTVTLNIFSGISNNGNPPTFNVTGTGNLQFFNNASAGSAIINMTGGSGASPTQFFGTSTAANATITLSNGSDLNFRDSSRAGNATITTNNGSDVFFFGNSTGGEARFITKSGGCLDISGLLSDGMTAGSIEGAGRYNLGSKQLTVGLNNRSTEVSGEIDDGGVGGGTGGSLTKVGTGTLILSGTNTYTGGTTISQGTLQLGNGGTTGSVKGNVLDNGVLAISRSGVVTQSEVIKPLPTNPATGIITGSGSLEQLGPGTLVLTGNNGYTGPTTVSGGTLGIGMGGSIAASSGVDLTASGTRFDISGAGGNQTIRDLSGVAASEATLGANTLTAGTANSTTFAGVISGTGEFAKQGTGTLTLSGNNIYTGGTTIKAGTLQLGNGGTTGSILGNVTDNGTLVFNRSDTVTFPGVISGTGGVRQIGPGTLTLTGVDTYSGGTNFEGGILAVQGNGHLGTGPLRFNGGALEELTGADLLEDLDITLGPAGGRFIADTATSSVFSGTISGPGSFIKDGPGALTILGDDTFSGGTTILDGTLVVGNLPGSQNAAQGTSTALGKGNVFLNGGTLRTTSFQTGVPLTINVGGNYTQGPGGTLSLGIGGTQPGQFDRVVVKGNADLNAKLVIFSLGGFHPSAGNEFELLSTGGTVSGNFSLLDDSQFNINPTIPGKLKVIPFEVVEKNGLLLVYETSKEEVVQLLNPTAEQLTALFEIPFSGANIQRFNLDDRMFQIQRSYVPPPFTFDFFTACRGVWASGWGEFGNVDDPGLAKGYRFTTGDMSAGVDDRLTDHLAVGLFGGYSHTWTDFRPGKADVDTGRGGLYATYFDPTGWWVNAGVWGGYNSYSTSRQALLGPANGSTDGYEVSTFGDAGYNFHCGDLVWGPLVAMQYTDAHVSGFSEHGSLVPMDVHSNSQDSLRTDVGAQASYNCHLGKTVVIPELKLAWEHEYRYSNLDISGSDPALNNASATFNGPNLGHDSLIIEANVGIQITRQIAATIGYDGQLGRDHYISNAVRGTFSYSF